MVADIDVRMALGKGGAQGIQTLKERRALTSIGG